MITQKTAEKIWAAYREIESAEKLLDDMEEARGRGGIDREEPTLKDAFGRRNHLQLGIPSGERSHTLYRVAPRLAESVIRSHIAAKRQELVDANECARIELETPAGVTECTD